MTQQHRGHHGTSDDVDDARLLPHLRTRKPVLIIAPDSGVTYTQTVQLGAKRNAHTRATAAAGEPGDLRGIPVVGARGVGGVSPGTQPEQVVVDKLMRAQKRQAA